MSNNQGEKEIIDKSNGIWEKIYNAVLSIEGEQKNIATKVIEKIRKHKQDKIKADIMGKINQ
ncbi:MAG: hypothetical protein US50_C0003G0010 [Candidatus Nomurabacteria bacterium GW2011_GWB1_37_5]|uniref:Uncharacterized protein n=1 Tax=Candidatus Nomurabacteria bacterium GW2011_GWB1_37_5 TaxID=1618742 RepID=A0A0G0HBH5_9BACT|nr:MAG: hypothetical protein US50_C0003G0010 [Candidatus Nomurabacteria bacterium GW2011_GWB1_37_5]